MLIERFASPVYRVARALTGSAFEAEAIVREVLVYALRETGPGRNGTLNIAALYRRAVGAALARLGADAPARSADRSARSGLAAQPRADAPAGSAAPSACSPEGAADTSWWHTCLPRFTADGHRDGADVLVDWSARPDADLLAGARDVVRDALDRLPDDLRVVVVLADAERLSTAEIAEVLGVPADVVRSRAHQARMVLRERVSEHLASGHAA